MNPNQKAVAFLLATVGGVLLARRYLRKHPVGDAIIGPDITVTPTVLTQEDFDQGALSQLQREAMDMLQVDLDTMEPTHHPNAMETIEAQNAIGKLRETGRAGDADFLATLLSDAQNLPPS